MTYPSSGAQWPCTIPSPTVSHSRVCDTQGGASGKASERRISGFRRRPVGAVAILLERVSGSATDCPAVARLSSPGFPYLGTSKIVSRPRGSCQYPKLRYLWRFWGVPFRFSVLGTVTERLDTLLCVLPPDFPV